MSLGGRIKSERERLGHTQEDWARQAGVHRNTQAKYEKGDAVPDVVYLSKIEELGAEVDFIRNGERRVWVSLEERIESQCALVYGVVEGVENCAQELKISLSPVKKASVVAMLYRAGHLTGKVAPAMIEEAVKLASD
jgi:DNA-binding XRE family transcriptional regulator